MNDRKIESKCSKEEINKNVDMCHMLQNKHERCADLDSKTRDAIERHYAMDYCLFDYESMPVVNSETCVGTINNKESMTLRFQECKLKLGWN